MSKNTITVSTNKTNPSKPAINVSPGIAAAMARAGITAPGGINIVRPSSGGGGGGGSSGGSSNRSSSSVPDKFGQTYTTNPNGSVTTTYANGQTSTSSSSGSVSTNVSGGNTAAQNATPYSPPTFSGTAQNITGLTPTQISKGQNLGTQYVYKNQTIATTTPTQGTYSGLPNTQYAMTLETGKKIEVTPTSVGEVSPFKMFNKPQEGYMTPYGIQSVNPEYQDRYSKVNVLGQSDTGSYLVDGSMYSPGQLAEKQFLTKIGLIKDTPNEQGTFVVGEQGVSTSALETSQNVLKTRLQGGKPEYGDYKIAQDYSLANESRGTTSNFVIAVKGGERFIADSAKTIYDQVKGFGELAVRGYAGASAYGTALTLQKLTAEVNPKLSEQYRVAKEQAFDFGYGDVASKKGFGKRLLAYQSKKEVIGSEMLAGEILLFKEAAIRKALPLIFTRAVNVGIDVGLTGIGGYIGYKGYKQMTNKDLTDDQRIGGAESMFGGSLLAVPGAIGLTSKGINLAKDLSVASELGIPYRKLITAQRLIESGKTNVYETGFFGKIKGKFTTEDYGLLRARSLNNVDKIDTYSMFNEIKQVYGYGKGVVAPTKAARQARLDLIKETFPLTSSEVYGVNAPRQITALQNEAIIMNEALFEGQVQRASSIKQTIEFVESIPTGAFNRVVKAGYEKNINTLDVPISNLEQAKLLASKNNILLRSVNRNEFNSLVKEGLMDYNDIAKFSSLKVSNVGLVKMKGNIFYKDWVDSSLLNKKIGHELGHLNTFEKFNLGAEKGISYANKPSEIAANIFADKIASRGGYKRTIKQYDVDIK
jgi:hypothetical protein